MDKQDLLVVKQQYLLLYYCATTLQEVSLQIHFLIFLLSTAVFVFIWFQRCKMRKISSLKSSFY